KVPDTILSRCQRHNFRRISTSRMAERLKAICKAEGITLGEAGLSLMVRQAEGGMRDALSLLDQVVSACGQAPADGEVAEVLGAIEGTLVQDLVAALVSRDAKPALERVDEVFQRGLDLKQLAEAVALALRHLFVTRMLGQPPSDLPDGEQAALRALASGA